MRSVTDKGSCQAPKSAPGRQRTNAHTARILTLMATVALGARVLLALVFLVAAVGKLADMDGTREALGEFHVPRGLIEPAAWLLPAAELLTAALLMIAPTARVGAILAILLLGAFVAGIAAAMARGRLRTVTASARSALHPPVVAP